MKDSFFPISLLPSGETISAEAGRTLLDSLGEKLPVRADCGGKGVCGKCKVFIEGSPAAIPLTDVERQQLSIGLINAGCRLACQVTVTEAMQIRLPNTALDKGHVGAKTVFSGPHKLAPSVWRRCLVRHSKSTEKNVPVNRSSASGWKEETIGVLTSFSDDHLESLLRPVPPEAKEVTAICRVAPGKSAIVAGHQPTSLGLAVDIGTTTVAAYLCDLVNGQILSSAAVLNPQRRHGEDVISRVQAAGVSAQGLSSLQRLIVETLHYLSERCLKDAGKSAQDVDDMVVVGNTAMQHIFSGIDPSPLGRTPFEPAVREAVYLGAAQLGFPFSPETTIFVMPVIAGFAGGDTVACALSDRIRHRDEMTLIVDVGTNGELILGNRKGLWSTSCATGPAFEGAQIACGMRATEGAISACSFDPSTRRFIFQTIGNGPDTTSPLGFCGSGVIDAVLALRNVGMLLPSGQLVDGASADGLEKVVILPSSNNPAGVEIYLSQRDIRQVQLAKAALATGIICLMEKAGVKQVDRTILTGAFGHAFNWRHAVAIGMLPDAATLGKIVTRNNLAGEGAVMALFDRHQRVEADEIRQQTEYLHLAEEPGFIRRFVAQTLFP